MVSKEIQPTRSAANFKNYTIERGLKHESAGTREYLAENVARKL